MIISEWGSCLRQTHTSAMGMKHVTTLLFKTESFSSSFFLSIFLPRTECKALGCFYFWWMWMWIGYGYGGSADPCSSK